MSMKLKAFGKHAIRKDSAEESQLSRFTDSASSYVQKAAAENQPARAELEVRWPKLAQLEDMFTDGDESRASLIFPAIYEAP